MGTPITPRLKGRGGGKWGGGCQGGCYTSEGGEGDAQRKVVERMPASHSFGNDRGERADALQDKLCGAGQTGGA